MKKSKLNEAKIEKEILEAIKERSKHKKKFTQLVNNFEALFSDFNPLKNCFNINDYFNEGHGLISATNKLITDKRIKKTWLQDIKNENEDIKSDFKGLYVFIHNKTPFYVGISKGVIGRILQHTKGHSHFTSTLAYNMGLIRYKILNKKEYKGTRDDFEFVKYVKPIKEILLKQKIALINIKNDEELYLFEIFCAMKLKTNLNKFRTH